MQSYYTPRNETNGPYLYRSKQNEILAFKKNIAVINWHQYGYKCETIHSAGFMISVSGSERPESFS